MSLLDLFRAGRSDAIMYLRQEGPLSRAELQTALEPSILQGFEVIGEEAREIPVTWSLKSIPQEEAPEGSTPILVYGWQVATPSELRGLESMLITNPLQVEEGSPNLQREISRYSERRPMPQITSYKLALRKKVRAMPTAEVMRQARSAWNAHVRMPGSYMRLALPDAPISGDRGEVPTPSARAAVPRWAIAAGALGLVGAVAIGMQESKKRKR